MTESKVVIITGASSGIGEACAWQFAKMGYNVVLAARRKDVIDRLAKELLTFGMGTMAVQTDVSDEQQCKQLIEKTMEQFGRIDVLLNNAGISMRSLFAEVDLKVLKQLMDINFWGTVYCTKYALPYVLKNHGTIAGVSSIAGKLGLPARTGYSASKFAMEGFLETLRIEHLKNGLHVLVACPGFTASNIRKVALTADGTPQGQTPQDENNIMSAAQVAKHIAWAIRKRKRDLILTRQGKLTVFFKKFLPGWIDKKIFQVMSQEEDSPIK